MNCTPILKTQKSLGIQNLSRLNEDSCYLDVRVQQSSKPGQYQTFNYYDCECGAPVARDVSLQQPAVLHRDGYGWTSNGGCNIDHDSKLRNARNMTNPRLIQQLHERPYMTVPYMGRGEGNPCLETVLLPGEATGSKRAGNTLSGIFIDRFDPQIPVIQENIQNPVHIIPEDTDSQWIRGGQPSRQIIRNMDYLAHCGYEQPDKLWQRPDKQ